MAFYRSGSILSRWHSLNLLRRFFTHRDDFTVKQTVDALGDKLSSSSVPEPYLSSKYLVSHVLGEVQAEGYLKFADRKLGEEQLTELNRMVNCRLARMPLQYIVGSWDFRNIQLKLRPPVFIPRQETEQLVQIVLDGLPDNKPLRILEIGPGSGNICLSLLQENPNVTVLALERSRVAAQLVVENAVDLGLDSRLTVRETRLDEETILDEKFDAVVSNPPYVLRKDLMNLAPEISVYEDLRALDGGAEGLDVILPLLKVSSTVLEKGGRVFLEVDPCHPHILPSRLPDFSFHLREVIEDFSGRERFLVLDKV